MCYAIPGKVIEINDGTVIVEYFGEKRKARNEFLDIKVGDYIYAQGGFVIDRVGEKEALETLSAWKELFVELKKIDLRLSRVTSEEEIEKDFSRIIDKVTEGKPLSRDELLKLLETENEKELDLLYRSANFLRQKHLSNACCVHGIIEFSNHCIRDCLYCGIRKSNNKLKRYRMSREEIVDAADYAVNKLGFKALVLQSGEDPFYTKEELIKLIKLIKERCAVFLIVSMGGREIEIYKGMYEAGARGALLRFETSNPVLYEKLHPGQDFKRRLKLLNALTDLGYLLFTGFLIGLGESDEDFLANILLTKELKAEMYSFGPFIPHPDTPLASSGLSSIEGALKAIALSRIVDPSAKIVVTTALETLDKKEGRRLGLLSGANSLMINVTPKAYRNLYEIYPDRAGIEGEVKTKIKETIDLLYSLGRAPTDLGI